MANVNTNEIPDIKILRHFIKDLSFENPQNPSKKSTELNGKDVLIDFEAVFQAYENQHFSVILKFKCKTKRTEERVFHLELDYVGFFKITGSKELNQDTLTNEAVRILFPTAKSIIADVSKNGGSIPLHLENKNFNLTKKL